MKVKRPAYSDEYLLDNTKKLVEKFGVDTIYETGTFTGGSTKILAETFPNVQIYSYEIVVSNYRQAVEHCKNNPNVKIRHMSSPEGLEKDVVNDKDNVFFFLDAHWQEYWPILDEFNVIKSKNVKPVVAVHDFFVPNEKGKPKFGFDRYKGQALKLQYIEPALKEVYPDGYAYHYSDKVDLNSGLIYIYKEK